MIDLYSYKNFLHLFFLFLLFQFLIFLKHVPILFLHSWSGKGTNFPCNYNTKCASIIDPAKLEPDLLLSVLFCYLKFNLTMYLLRYACVSYISSLLHRTKTTQIIESRIQPCSVEMELPLLTVNSEKQYPWHLECFGYYVIPKMRLAYTTARTNPLIVAFLFDNTPFQFLSSSNLMEDLGCLYLNFEKKL